MVNETKTMLTKANKGEQRHKKAKVARYGKRWQKKRQIEAKAGNKVAEECKRRQNEKQKDKILLAGSAGREEDLS